MQVSLSTLAAAAAKEDAASTTSEQSQAVEDLVEDDANAAEPQVGQKRKERCTWTEELHSKFVDAVEQLGVDQAKPLAIMDIMKVDFLTKANVKSHLQKYRIKVHSMKNRGEAALAGLALLAGMDEEWETTAQASKSSALEELTISSTAKPKPVKEMKSKAAKAVKSPPQAKPVCSTLVQAKPVPVAAPEAAPANASQALVVSPHGAPLTWPAAVPPANVVPSGSSQPLGKPLIQFNFHHAVPPACAPPQRKWKVYGLDNPPPRKKSCKSELTHLWPVGPKPPPPPLMPLIAPPPAAAPPIAPAPAAEEKKNLESLMREAGATLAAQNELQRELSKQMAHQQGLQQQVEQMLGRLQSHVTTSGASASAPQAAPAVAAAAGVGDTSVQLESELRNQLEQAVAVQRASQQACEQLMHNIKQKQELLSKGEALLAVSTSDVGHALQ